MAYSNLLVGVAAGLAALLLFAAVLTGTPIALPLFFLAPLPIAIAGFGWGPVAGAVAALVVALGLAVAISWLIAIIILMVFAAPTAWGVYLLGLSRPGPDTAAPPQWYPLGRVLLNLTFYVGVAIVIAGTLTGYDRDLFARTVSLGLIELSETEGGPPITAEDSEALGQFVASVTPAATAGWALTMLIFNLWLGGRISLVSGRLQRPWVPLWSAGLPSWVAGVFVVAVLVGLLGGSIAQAGQVIAGASGLALALVGLSAIHVGTLRLGGRGGVLAAIYLALVLFAALLLIPLGIAELFYRFRERRGIAVA